MAKALSFFLFVLLLSICSSGTELGFSIDAREGISASSLSKTLSLLELDKVSASRIHVFLSDVKVLRNISNSNVPGDLYLNENIVKNLTDSKSSAALWLKTHVASFLPHINIKSITLEGSNDLSKLLSSMKLIHSVVSSFQFDDQIKVSAAFSLELLENWNRVSPKNLHKVLSFIKKTKSFVIVEVGFDDYGFKLGKLDSFLKSKVCSHHLDIVLTIKRLADPSKNEVVECGDKLSKSVVNSQISSRIVEFYVQVKSVAEKTRKIKHKQTPFRRELLKDLGTFSHDSIMISPDNPTPNIVTVQPTNPVTITPNIPASTPLPIPSTTPVMVPPTSPSVNTPITNPVTTYPVAPPATTNAPAVQGQSWCVAKTGATEAVLQSALDYACGIGGADCSQIQQGSGCYSPNTLQNHASFAFNSYYQKNPVATSCDFGGAASLVSTNPSTGSCIFPSSSTASTHSLPGPTTSTTNPAITPITTNPATTPVTPVSGDSGFGTPPSVLNSSSPDSDFGSESPPGIGLNSSASKIVALQPIISCIAFLFARMVFLVL